jgi:hypothetical protein
MIGYVAWLGDRFSSVGAATANAAKPEGGTVTIGTGTGAGAGTGTETAGGGCWPVLAPRGACCYKIAMAIVMGYMLIVMV